LPQFLRHLLFFENKLVKKRLKDAIAAEEQLAHRVKRERPKIKRANSFLERAAKILPTVDVQQEEDWLLASLVDIAEEQKRRKGSPAYLGCPR